MTSDFIILNDTIILSGLSKGGKFLYILKIILPVSILIFLFWFYNASLFVIILCCIFLAGFLWRILFIPARFFSTKIVRLPDGLLINQKRIPFEDLLFLSIREKDAYAIIRLEAKRKNIMIPNEVILKSNCTGYEQALAIARSLRDFIHPGLRINHIKIGFSGGVASRGNKNENIEIWEEVY